MSILGSRMENWARKSVKRSGLCHVPKMLIGRPMSIFSDALERCIVLKRPLKPFLAFGAPARIRCAKGWSAVHRIEFVICLNHG
jgi:hypothetical protein